MDLGRFKFMKEGSFAINSINLLAVSQNMVESYDSTIALRFNGNQALRLLRFLGQPGSHSSEELPTARGIHL